jgi:hypothetical protein
LRRQAGTATYLYQDGARYWYSTQPTMTKLAEDGAEQLKRDPDRVMQDIDKRLRAGLAKASEFSRVHPMPQSSQDVPDDVGARLVVLGICTSINATHVFLFASTSAPATSPSAWTARHSSTMRPLIFR